ncbi:hypothetical protein BDY17DRAFT_318542 [Neohortaea acidophila]|uniref:DNA replication complex GINS protein PSF2 n=1 Tax=Neohortaea acidophila TaxID=245834 RepID=A0A6A6PJN5_9PEZI|nr:uncharacterized protein BDY17DRAFT_318542 [Neohortaea acidophila]KAF2479921.1 hypothetical protein BDY17DRAFT_318542 [Neohortaea acidophila]
MALLLPPGLTPAEVGFLCEMELVTVIPRQRLDELQLLGGPTQPLNPPFPTPLPLWLALLLKRQKRANISPPPWLSVECLTSILDFETDVRTAEVLSPPPKLPRPTGVALEDEPYLSHESSELSPPFLPESSTSQAQSDALPYHWLELGHLLLTHAADDFDDANAIRRLLRDLQEVRMSKLRKGFRVLGPGAGVKMNGVGGMEVAEIRGFLLSGMSAGTNMMCRRINRPNEENQKEREANERENGFGGDDYQDDEDDMQL